MASKLKIFIVFLQLTALITIRQASDSDDTDNDEPTTPALIDEEDRDPLEMPETIDEKEEREKSWINDY